MSVDDPRYLKDPLYFQDFLIESQQGQCWLCGEIGPEADLVKATVDEGEPVQICPSCEEERPK